MLSSAAFCQTTAPAPPALPPGLTASQLLEMRMSDDPKVRAQGDKPILADRIVADLANPDPTVRQGAVDVLKKLVAMDLRDPAGKPVVRNRSESFCRCLGKESVKSLLALGQGELIKNLAAAVLAEGPSPAPGDRAQAALVEMLLDTQKFEEALAAAKTYYNYCTLEHSQAAAGLVAEALANGPGKTDSTILRRFRQQQTEGAKIPGADGSPASSDLGDNVLKSIVVDPKPYQDAIARLAAGRQAYETLTHRGNLLLLSDKGAEAKTVFESALDLATTQKEITDGVANIARAIRARDGNIAAANAYLMSLRGQDGGNQGTK